MIRLISPKILLTLLFFGFIRFVDANLIFKGVIFILISITLIYTHQKKLNYYKIIFLIFFSLSFIIFNEKKQIYEINAPLKLSQDTENKYVYEKIFSKDQFNFIKKHYINKLPICYVHILNCFEQHFKEYSRGYSRIDVDINYYTSPDQIFFNANSKYTRKVKNIEISSLSHSRLSFINYFSGNINRSNISKLDTPFYIKYSNLDSVNELCFKGIVILIYQNHREEYFQNTEIKCIEKPIKNFIGINLPDNNLQVFSKSNSYDIFFDEIFIIFFLIFLLMNINFNYLKNYLTLSIPTLLSIFIIFYISRYDNWFYVFELFKFYFFGFEGGDGLGYINFASDIYLSLINADIFGIFNGGEDIFYFTPGLRYFLFFNQIISGDFYYLYYFTLFFIPKIIFNFLNNQFEKKISYFLMLSFLILPIFHHLGFSYYQFIRHSYRLYPEPLGYMFFIAGLTIFLNSFKKNYLKMNLLFAISVFFRPNLILSIVLIMVTKTIYEKINIFNYKYFIPLIFISLIYLFPLIHNLYFGNSFTLFTNYGSNMMNLDFIKGNDFEFYINKYKLINLLFVLLIFVPGLNIYLKIIIITQYLTLFWFETLDRYYWIYWLVSLNLLYDTLSNLFKNKWKFHEKYISN